MAEQAKKDRLRIALRVRFAADWLRRLVPIPGLTGKELTAWTIDARGCDRENARDDRV
ncbi:hypothetical protein [Tistlia consotensis]|uniref:hypothetical protein n=1 Tax=Tistlia consotensis TaxID=1321365 RepID=UPI001356554C|nr:hypothetical protein [Tistlia consotensis]